MNVNGEGLRYMSWGNSIKIKEYYIPTNPFKSDR